MYRTGVYFGRFLPPHRGHLYQMIEASTRCEKLLVVISDNADQTREICRRDGIPEISYRLRKQWISSRFRTLPTLVYGYWTRRISLSIRRDGELWASACARWWGEPSARHTGRRYGIRRNAGPVFPRIKGRAVDPARTRYPISATDIRSDILGNWDYILGAARPFFTKKVLIGTEKLRKTTLTKCSGLQYFLGPRK